MIEDDRIGSRIEEMVYDYNEGILYTGITLSRVEEQIKAKVNGEAYTGPIMSRIEDWIVNDAPIDLLISRLENILTYEDEYPGPWLSRLEGLLKGFSRDKEYKYKPLQANTGAYLETSSGDVLYARLKKGG